eukprot:2017020-Amphidinium_carterae.1
MDGSYSVCVLEDFPEILAAFSLLPAMCYASTRFLSLKCALSAGVRSAEAHMELAARSALNNAFAARTRRVVAFLRDQARSERAF